MISAETGIDWETMMNGEVYLRPAKHLSFGKRVSLEKLFLEISYFCNKTSS